MSLLRQALGTGQTPPNQVLVGISLFLTLFIMAPTFNAAYEEAISPYLEEQISFDDAVLKTEAPFRTFMLNQTRETDIAMFAEIARHENLDSPADVPFTTLVPAFITSELKSAFAIGFLIYIPFVVIDLVVASVLMSMGMMMLSPMMISMPFKLMLFVLVDGCSAMGGLDKFGTGQAMSYSRKYAFLNLLNLKTGIKDDDGFTAKPFKQNSVEKSAEPTYMDESVNVDEIKDELKNAQSIQGLNLAKNKHRDSVHFLLKNNLRAYRQVTDIAESRELQLNNGQQ